MCANSAISCATTVSCVIAHGGAPSEGSHPSRVPWKRGNCSTSPRSSSSTASGTGPEPPSWSGARTVPSNTPRRLACTRIAGADPGEPWTAASRSQSAAKSADRSFSVRIWAASHPTSSCEPSRGTCPPSGAAATKAHTKTIESETRGLPFPDPVKGCAGRRTACSISALSDPGAPGRRCSYRRA